MYCTNDILHHQTREVKDVGIDCFPVGLIMAKSDDDDDDDYEVTRLHEEKKYRVVILVR